MPHHRTQPPGRPLRRLSEADIIEHRVLLDRRRRRGQRGTRHALAPGSVVGYFPHAGGSIRIRAGEIDGTQLHVDGSADPHLAAEASAAGRSWEPIGLISHRVAPLFRPTGADVPWLEEADELARKGVDLYYYVVKGYVTNPADEIIAAAEPEWIEIDVKAT